MGWTAEHLQALNERRAKAMRVFLEVAKRSTDPVIRMAMGEIGAYDEAIRLVEEQERMERNEER